MPFPLITCLAMLALVSGIIVTLLALQQVEDEQQARAQVFMALLTHKSGLSSRTAMIAGIGVAPSGSVDRPGVRAGPWL